LGRKEAPILGHLNSVNRRLPTEDRRSGAMGHHTRTKPYELCMPTGVQDDQLGPKQCTKVMDLPLRKQQSTHGPGGELRLCGPSQSTLTVAHPREKNPSHRRWSGSSGTATLLHSIWACSVRGIKTRACMLACPRDLGETNIEGEGGSRPYGGRQGARGAERASASHLTEFAARPPCWRAACGQHAPFPPSEFPRKCAFKKQLAHLAEVQAGKTHGPDVGHALTRVSTNPARPGPRREAQPAAEHVAPSPRQRRADKGGIGRTGAACPR